ncbi:hypothetical protein I552_7557 [Mycobacterium xenopi 3993]|nr:hypothetical protein I552_7557 [Mycobacterium xenopi 3993]
MDRQPNCSSPHAHCGVMFSRLAPVRARTRGPGPGLDTSTLAARRRWLTGRGRGRRRSHRHAAADARNPEAAVAQPPPPWSPPRGTIGGPEREGDDLRNYGREDGRWRGSRQSRAGAGAGAGIRTGAGAGAGLERVLRQEPVPDRGGAGAGAGQAGLAPRLLAVAPALVRRRSDPGSAAGRREGGWRPRAKAPVPQPRPRRSSTR